MFEAHVLKGGPESLTLTRVIQRLAAEGIGVGTRVPVCCTAAGKAFLTRMPAAEQQDLTMRLRLTRCTPTTITTKAALRRTQRS